MDYTDVALGEGTQYVELCKWITRIEVLVQLSIHTDIMTSH